MGMSLTLQGGQQSRVMGGAVPPAQVLLLTTSKPGVIVIIESLGDRQKIFTSISEKTN